MKKQVIIIHGGRAFRTHEKYIEYLKNKEVSLEYFLYKKGWKSDLPSTLGKKFEVLAPHMPNKQSAKYDEWKIWFERLLPFLKDDVILVGHSMGGIFLVKYLSENNFPKTIGAIFLVAAPFNLEDEIHEFRLEKDLKKVWEQCQIIHLYQSQDDMVVPESEVEEYKKAWPEAKLHIFEDRGHFNQENFPELVAEIRGLRDN